jgi:hypothetical protein
MTLLAGAASNGAPQLVSAKRIWDAGEHNAFTDLTRFDGKWFCTFRESRAQVGGNGKIRVLTSADSERWESAALLSEEGIDLRDPKLSVTPSNRLMLVLGGSVYDGKTLKERQSRVAFSANGRDWSSPQRVLEKGDWLWRVTWHNGHAYGIAYNSMAKGTASSAAQAEDWTATLVESDDGVAFHPVTRLDVPGHPNEATVRFRENGDCVALLRREGLPGSTDNEAWIGLSQAPYKQLALRRAENRRSEFPHSLGRRHDCQRPSVWRQAGGEQDLRWPDGPPVGHTGADPAKRWRLQLRGHGCAGRFALGEPLLVPRRQDLDLLGESPAPRRHTVRAAAALGWSFSR